MAEYQTKQRAMLLEYLRKNAQKEFTPEELAAAMSDVYGAAAPGKSTVYRLIEKLEKEILVRRFERSDARGNLFQLAACGNCNRFHLKCTGCGKLIHMDSSAGEQLLREVQSKDHFHIDERQTVLYGTCAECGQKGRRNQ